MSAGKDSFGVVPPRDSNSTFATCGEDRSAKSGSSRGSLRSQQHRFHLRLFTPGTSEVESMLESSFGSIQCNSTRTGSIQYDGTQTEEIDDSIYGNILRNDAPAASTAGTTFSLGGRVKRNNFTKLKNTYVYRKLPCSKQIWLVYFLFFLYGLAEFSTNLLLFFLLHAYRRLNSSEKVASYLSMRFLIYTSFPVTGFLADTFFGRYKVILASLYVALFGAVTLAIAFSTPLDPWLDSHADYSFLSGNSWPDETVLVLCVFGMILWVGFTGVRVNLIPFGVDQLPEASSGELSSYFHWYYWWMNAGYLVASVVLPYIFVNSSFGYVFLLIAGCFAGSILVLVLYRDNGFVLQPHTGNPLKLVFDVIRSSLRAKRPHFRSAFDIGRPPPSRVDLTMNIHGGHFTVEQVEDVKTFFRILLILLSFFGYFAVASQLQTTYLLEGMRMTVPPGCTEECPSLEPLQSLNVSSEDISCRLWIVSPSLWLGLANIVPVLILIPICDRLVYPCFRLAMLKRMAAGKFFLFFSILVAIAVEVVRHNQLSSQLHSGTPITVNAIPFHTGTTIKLHVASPMPISWIIPQYFLFAFAEVLANITAVEFIYAQSPAAMKGILLGLLFGTEGIAMGCAALIVYLQGMAAKFNFFSFFGNSDHYIQDFLQCFHARGTHCQDGPLFGYILVGLFVFFSVIFFCIAAIRYKFRKREIDPYNPNF